MINFNEVSCDVLILNTDSVGFCIVGAES